MKLGIIARSDNTGLGNQTKELVDMLNPDKIMLINSYSFNENKQHPEWYEEYNCQHINGFPMTEDVRLFLKNLDVVLSCETFYNKNFVTLANRKKIKTILQYNYEFLDYLSWPDFTYTLPTILASPSIWGIDVVKNKFSDNTKIIHLPPPTNHTLFSKVKNNNIKNDHNRILHVAGKAAHLDRNGTNTVLKMLQYSKADYQLVIKSQSEIHTKIKDSRLVIELNDIKDKQDIYDGFDAMILPRRYGGLCLPMNEALLSGLPVFMTDISPNNTILPNSWLIKSKKIDEFEARTRIDVYDANPAQLAKLVDDYINSKNKIDQKEIAFKIGYENFSTEILKPKYLDILK